MYPYCIGVIALVALLTAGCSTRPKMAFEADGKQAEPNKTVLLMSFTVRNNYRAAYQPRLFAATIDRSKPREFADRFVFTMEDKGRNETDTPAEGNTYLLRMPIEPGAYVFQGLVSRVGALCPPVCSVFFTPLMLPITPQRPGVVYIGHVSATVRMREGDEFRAGYLVPLIEQALVGASGGSFDVEVSDRYATDEPLFRSQFPALKEAAISKAVLAPFDRAKVQKWWEAHGNDPYLLLQLPPQRR